MWEHHDDQGGGAASSENRLFLVFASGPGALRAFGPYRSVQVTGDSVWVFERDSLLKIAAKGPGGLWEIPDGSDHPESFRHVVALCPPAGVTAGQLESCLGLHPPE